MVFVQIARAPGCNVRALKETVVSIGKNRLEGAPYCVDIGYLSLIVQ